MSVGQFTRALRIWFALLGGSVAVIGVCIVAHGGTGFEGILPEVGLRFVPWGWWAVAAGTLTAVGTAVPRTTVGSPWSAAVRVGLALTFGFAMARMVTLLVGAVTSSALVSAAVTVRLAAWWVPVWAAAWVTLLMRHAWGTR